MVKVLLIRPDLVGTPYAMRKFRVQHQPLGILSLAATSLREPGVEIKIADEIVGDQTLSIIDSYRPDVVGITVATTLFKRANFIGQHAKDLGATVIFGGPHCSAMPQLSLESSCADAVVYGEGDLIFPKLLTSSDWSTIEGIVYRSNGTVIKNPPAVPIQDLDALPYPARHLLDDRKYYHDAEFGFHVPYRDRMMRIFASRGCAQYCSFCGRHVVFTRNTRFRSPESLKEEILYYKKTYNCRSIMFMDDTFTESDEHCIGISEMLLENNIKLNWGCFSRVRIKKDILVLMKRAGLRMIEFGIESGSPRILQAIRKNISIDQIIETYRYVRELGIKTKAFFIIGLPGETEEDFRMSLDLAKKVNPNYVLLTSYVPLPGSELFEKLGIDVNTLYGRSWFFPDDPVEKRRYKRFLVEYYLRPRYIKLFIKSMSTSEIRYFFNMALAHFVRQKG